MFERLNPLQKFVAYSCLVLFFLVAVFSASSLHAAVKIGATAPPFSLKDTQGKTHSLATGKGTHITMLYFFDFDSQSSREGLVNISLLHDDIGGWP
ncbi:MAG: hypothetical protein PHF56_13075 [Desulfuromonadaceae bacterium]|nr:hypothetical protein [Desulfuromonadaceae bacterium]